MAQDPYCYPNTDILINKFGIKNKSALHKIEANFVGLASFELYNKPIKGSFDYLHLREIHKFLFQDLYEWAGQTRTVFMEKYYPELDRVKHFAVPQFIEPSIKEVFRELSHENYLSGIKDVPMFANRISYYMSEVNAIHPFREGNGRTQREYFRCLALENGFDLDWSKVDAQELTKARAMSINDPLHLEFLLHDCLTKLPVSINKKNYDRDR